MRTLVWLASYPKSGSTWLRTLLAGCLRGPAAADVNELDWLGSASARWLFDLLAGFSSARLPSEAVDALRPAVYRHYDRLSDVPKPLKVHEAFRTLPSGEPLFPPDASRGVVCLVRNPLDIAVSYSRHRDEDLDATIAFMLDPRAVLAPEGRRLHTQLPQPMGAWSTQVQSWLSCPLRVHLLRYEDLLADTAGQLARMFRFLDIPVEPERLAEVIALSRFDTLREQEIRRPFRERKGKAPFFRNGTAGDGAVELTERQRDRLIAASAGTMRRLGYLQA